MHDESASSCVRARGGGFRTVAVVRLSRCISHASSPQLGDYVSDVASNMMQVEEHILWMAQNEARACTRIVQCVERIADLALSGDNQVISKVHGGTHTHTYRLMATLSQGEG